jgi:hypothetical protein
LKKLVVFLFVLFVVLVSNVQAQMCPSATTFIRILAIDDNTKQIHLSVMQVAPKLLPGTDSDCPSQDVMAQMLEIDYKNNTVKPIPIAIQRGAVSSPENVLNEEEIKLFQEKGIVNPPKQATPKPETKPAPSVPKKGSTTADVKAEALYSSSN